MKNSGWINLSGCHHPSVYEVLSNFMIRPGTFCNLSLKSNFLKNTDTCQLKLLSLFVFEVLQIHPQDSLMVFLRKSRLLNLMSNCIHF